MPNIYICITITAWSFVRIFRIYIYLSYKIIYVLFTIGILFRPPRLINSPRICHSSSISTQQSPRSERQQQYTATRGIQIKIKTRSRAFAFTRTLSEKKHLYVRKKYSDTRLLVFRNHESVESSRRRQRRKNRATPTWVFTPRGCVSRACDFE